MCMDAAIDAITAQGLQSELATAGARPHDVTLVVASGVFTSPIEWTALLLAAGCQVRIKAPSATPKLCMALAEDLSAAGLPVRCDVDRDLGTPDAVVGFGGDAAMADIKAATPQARHSLYGHRFSVAVVTQNPVAAAKELALDAAMYDGRGCMAPTAVFTTQDPAVLSHALAEAMAQAEVMLPRGEVDDTLGPEWRRRCGLARITHHCHEGSAWAVPVLDATHFMPVALPRMLPVHGVAHVEDIESCIQPWTHQLSTCGTDDPAMVPGDTLRTCGIGQMQRPEFPRAHDGRAMLGSVLG